jgi:hypothetical protein
MSKLLSVSVNLGKLKNAKHRTSKGTDCLLIPLSQSGLYVSEKTGDVFLNLTMSLKDETDERGNNGAAWLSQPKDERDQEKVYVGNPKVFWEGEDKPKSEKAGERHDVPKNTSSEVEEDDLPF